MLVMSSIELRNQGPKPYKIISKQVQYLRIPTTDPPVYPGEAEFPPGSNTVQA